ncbi:carbohydrate kinase [Peteryoungia desertarenae]|uniref:Carbohydrate kinase n=1 Tax=Peteryoungia desertarenae TaxID=1813451 RepID=A0ABX6QIA2_9HYPH|nr:FGGY-family carbohydrate kinase [Peteryoungia desertarenae]QLF68255.1 carbohydrate kinase [Peteryoungia desertarenae]
MSNRTPARIAVIDIGKTNAKVVVVDAASARELGLRKTPNTVRRTAPYPHFDTEALWQFILSALKDLAVEPGYDAISITTHGASAALLDAQGNLALPVLEYEHLYPDEINRSYDQLRPDFGQTFSPCLAGGLNLGAQFHYQKTAYPKEFARVATIVTYPQYWAFRLTGVAANETTSLGCHTDLWLPFDKTYSPLVDRLDIRDKLAPIRSAFDVLGDVRPEIATAIGLTKPVSVQCGIHDSNASLLPHLIGFGAPCTVVSTGTWVICFAAGGKPENLDPMRDTLVNVDAYGNPVPSARFMGGREWELLTAGLPAITESEAADALNDVIAKRIMHRPGLVNGSGPFPTGEGRWTRVPETPAATHAAASLYEALMTATCLDLIAADGPIIIEGPFASNGIYTAALASLTGRSVYISQAITGTAIGAALLTGTSPVSELAPVPSNGLVLNDYATHWRALN